MSLNKLMEILNPFESKPKEDIVIEISTPLTGTNTQPTIGLQSIGTVIDPSVEEHFIKLMKDANLPGPDYFEFKNAINQNTLPIAENMLFQTVFNTFKAMGVEKNILLSSLDEYISIITKDKEAFELQIKTKQDEDIVRKQSILNQHQLKITELNNEIARLNNESNQIQQEINNSQLQISNITNAYNLSLNNVLQTLQSDKQKINQYI